MILWMENWGMHWWSASAIFFIYCETFAFLMHIFRRNVLHNLYDINVRTPCVKKKHLSTRPTHSQDPVVIIVFARVVRTRPHFSKQNKIQWSLLVRLWVWSSWSLMTLVSLCPTPLFSKQLFKFQLFKKQICLA